MMQRMSPFSRILVALGALAWGASYFLPVWAIYLLAPQYPEGLSMQIWLTKLTGDVDIINGLNHYIGMKKIEASMFPEFKFLVYFIAFYIVAGLVVAATGSRKLLLFFLVLVGLGAVAAGIDFYMWGYDYGHNLDPHAAIQVPGLSYQPPLVGHKKLLNFDAYSYPDTGAWIIIVATIIMAAVWFMEWRKHRKPTTTSKMKRQTTPVAILLLAIFLSGCKVKLQPVQFGKDACAECRMTIMDPKFGGQILTKKGKAYLFDDCHCMAAFLKKRTVSLDQVHKMVFLNYAKQNDWVPARKAFIVLSSNLKSPMGSHAAAFPDRSAAEAKARELDGRVTDWATLYNILQ